MHYLKCSGCVNGKLSSDSLALKCLPLFIHKAFRFKVAISPSLKITVYLDWSWICFTVASTFSFESGCLSLIMAPFTKLPSPLMLMISLSLIFKLGPVVPWIPFRVTLTLICLSTLLTFASQYAPLYLAETWVPMARNAGSPTYKERKKIKIL